jgi:hypothetical protein
MNSSFFFLKFLFVFGISAYIPSALWHNYTSETQTYQPNDYEQAHHLSLVWMKFVEPAYFPHYYTLIII